MLWVSFCPVGTRYEVGRVILGLPTSGYKVPSGSSPVAWQLGCSSRIVNRFRQVLWSGSVGLSWVFSYTCHSGPNLLTPYLPIQEQSPHSQSQ